MTGREVLSWDGFGEAVAVLARSIAESGFRPDVVVSVARGGLALGMALGYALDVKRVATVNVELYTGVDERLPAPILVPPVLRPDDLAGQQVLVADDIADTGLTLRYVQDHCGEHVRTLRTAVVFHKARSAVRPDYAWRSTEAWVDFPWSATAPVVGRVG